LNNLVGKSLVVVEIGQSPRYRFLETIREYALNKLQEQGTVDAVRERHLDFFTQLAEQGDRPAWETQDAARFGWLEIEHNNLRAALEFALSHRNVEMALRLSGALGSFWHSQSFIQEGDGWYQRVIQLETVRGVPELRARVLSNAGTLKWVKSDFFQAKGLHQQALNLYRTGNDLRGIAFSLNNIGTQCLHLGEHDEAKKLFEEGSDVAQESQNANLEILLLNSLAIEYWEGHRERIRAKILLERALVLARQASNPHHAMMAANLGELEGELGNYPQALVYLEEALFQLEQSQDLFILCDTEREKGVILSAMEDTAAARSWFVQSLRTAKKIDSHFEFATTIAHLAALEARTDSPRHAAALAAFAKNQINETLAAHFRPSDLAWFEPLITELREILGSVEFEEAWAKGRAMTRDEVLAIVLTIDH
jgi:tetratricopeptide (TPR) repeat protein